MGNGQINLFMEYPWEQLSCADTRSQYFSDPILSVVPSYDLARETIEFQELPHLVGIPRRYDYFVAPFSELLNDRDKEWDVRGIVDIDPDSSSYIYHQIAVGFIHADTAGSLSG